MLDKIIFIIGKIEFRGVLSSWATEEKKIDLILYEYISNSFILEMSLQIAIICVPLLIKEVLT